MTEQQTRRVNPMVIKNRRPNLPERGKIKIGEKGTERKSAQGKTFQPPTKLDHFIITTLERGPDGNFLRDAEAHERFGEAPTELPVRLLYNDPELNFATRYAAYAGRQVFCTGDGESALRMVEGKQTAVACPCERLERGYNKPDRCKINGILSVLLDGMPGIGGIWKFRTTSFNSVDGLTASLHFMRQITGGQLAGIPLMLTLKPKQATDPEGKQQVIYVVGLEFRGTTDELRDAGYKIALGNVQAGLRLDNLEAEAKRLLPDFGGAVFPGEDVEDVQAEFYPQAVKADPPKPKSPAPASTQGASISGTEPAPAHGSASGSLIADPILKALYDAMKAATEKDGLAGLAKWWRENQPKIKALSELQSNQMTAWKEEFKQVLQIGGDA